MDIILRLMRSGLFNPLAVISATAGNIQILYEADNAPKGAKNEAKKSTEYPTTRMSNSSLIGVDLPRMSITAITTHIAQAANVITVMSLLTPIAGLE
jgi:hypothetical protein